MELLLALVCDDARPNEEGKMDIHGVFHDLYAPGFPARQDSMVLVLVLEWDREDQGRYTFKLDLVGPDDRPTLTVDGHTDVGVRRADEPPARTRLTMPLEDVVFPVPGRYRFQLRVKGRTLDGPSLHLVRTEASRQRVEADDGPAAP